MRLRSPIWFLPNWPVPYPNAFSAVAIVEAANRRAGLADRGQPVRIGNSPVMKLARPAVQLGSA